VGPRNRWRGSDNGICSPEANIRYMYMELVATENRN
jgi:hypothetical protein